MLQNNLGAIGTGKEQKAYQSKEHKANAEFLLLYF